MKWHNLKQNKCPQCSKSLVSSYDIASNMFSCPCGFKIGTEKFNSIIAKQVNKSIDDSHSGETGWSD
jgi:DNA-directed RNA polymerase subunit RPC12/RpoP